MTTIANDSTMSKEMKEAIMNNVNGKMMMHGNMSMMKKCKSDTLMMKSMIFNMMKACKSDTSMMSSMCKTMMGDQQMKDMMQKKMAEIKI